MIWHAKKLQQPYEDQFRASSRHDTVNWQNCLDTANIDRPKVTSIDYTTLPINKIPH